MSHKTWQLGIVTGMLMFVGLLLAPAATAGGCGGLGGGCQGGGGQSGSSSAPPPSSSTKSNTYTSTSGGSPVTCNVYANGNGMGSYCITLGAGTVKTLRERFGTMPFQQCRFSDLPTSIPAPFNANPAKGRFMLRTCLQNVSFDTYAGGNGRTVAIGVVFVDWGTDISILHNPITDFLWSHIETEGMLPVPFLQTRPNSVPVVGTPTYFTFRWMDPNTHQIIDQGPYAGKATGGPYKQIVSNGGVIVRAEAQSVRVDPNQSDVQPVDCAPGTPYVEGALPSQQPADACTITFKHDSASAEKYTTVPLPPEAQHEQFNTSITVTWKVTYGRPGDMHNLGLFIMNLRQLLPVQEVQVPNQPPVAIF